MLLSPSIKNKHLIGNNKNINNRFISANIVNTGTLIIDLTYYTTFIENKIKYNVAFKQHWIDLISGKNNIHSISTIDTIFDPILKIKRRINISSIVLLCKETYLQSSTEKELFKLLASGIANTYILYTGNNNISTVYSLAMNRKETYVLLSDNINYWSICSRKSKIIQCVIIKNNNIRFYFDKLGLEYISQIINTNRLINKVRLSKLKYVNLQYLYILLLYVEFKCSKVGADKLFSIDTLNKTGKMYDLLYEAHKEISYYFLTKPDIIDIFLTSSTTHFILNMSRLLKIQKFDLVLLSKFSLFYSKIGIKYIDITEHKLAKTYYKIVIKSKLYNSKNTLLSIHPKQVKLSSSSLSTDLTAEDIVSSVLRTLTW